jgi:hypothetical protein
MVFGIGKRSWAERKRQIGKVATLAGVAGVGALPALAKTALPQIMMLKAQRLIGKV